MSKIKIYFTLLLFVLNGINNVNAQKKIGCPRNFDGKTFALIKNEILNHTGEPVAFDGEVIEIEEAYNGKPYFKVKFENEETIWIASMIKEEYIKIGANLRLLGYIDRVKSNDEIGKKFNKDGFHILTFAILDLETKKLGMLPEYKTQGMEWFNGKLPEKIE